MKVWKMLLTFIVAMMVGSAFHFLLQRTYGSIALTPCAHLTQNCAGGECQPDSYCKQISTGGTCGCVSTNPWPYSGGL
jgi:hypothetical protein